MGEEDSVLGHYICLIAAITLTREPALPPCLSGATGVRPVIVSVSHVCQGLSLSSYYAKLTLFAN